MGEIGLEGMGGLFLPPNSQEAEFAHPEKTVILWDTSHLPLTVGVLIVANRKSLK